MPFFPTIAMMVMVVMMMMMAAINKQVKNCAIQYKKRVKEKRMVTFMLNGMQLKLKLTCGSDVDVVDRLQNHYFYQSPF